jgi:hypothetical protein
MKARQRLAEIIQNKLLAVTVLQRQSDAIREPERSRRDLPFKSHRPSVEAACGALTHLERSHLFSAT